MLTGEIGMMEELMENGLKLILKVSNLDIFLLTKMDLY